MSPKFLAATSFIGLIACFNAGRPDGLTARRTPADSVIYGILLDSLGPRAPITYVTRQYVGPYDRGGNVRRTAEWAAARLPSTDADFLLATGGPASSRTLEQALGPIHGVVWIDATSSSANSRQTVEESRVITLSRVAYTSDSGRAAVYITLWCGGFCGYGGYYLFERSSAGAWLLIGKATTYQI